MNNKEYLQQAYWLNELIESDLKDLEDLKSKRISLESLKLEPSVKNGKNSSGARYTYIVDKIVDLEEKIDNEIDRYIDLKEEIRSAIIRVSDADEQVVLRCRYLNFMKWEDIACYMNYSEQHIYRLHRQALDNFKR